MQDHILLRKFGDAAVPSRIWGSLLIESPEGCWLWTGYLDRGGYGFTRCAGKHAHVHRFIYESLVGPVPLGLELDHLCRVRACANPAHLEPVDHRENVLRSPIGLAAINARKTHCKRGHPFNAPTAAGRKRVCRPCQNEWRRHRRATDPEYAERVRLQQREADRRRYPRRRAAA